MIAKSMKAALMVGTALALSISAAQAASMAKAGMDKRVADLERELTLLKSQMKSAMMSKKGPDKNIVSGNSRVRVTLYGQVNRAVRFASTPSKSHVQSVDNDQSSSRFGLRAAGKMNPNLSASALIELEVKTGHRSGQDIDDDSAEFFRIRHSTLSLSHKDMGTLSLGQTVIAGGISGMFSYPSGISIVFGPGGPAGDDGVTANMPKDRHGPTFGLFAARQNTIKYQTPNLMGLKANVSWNESRSWSAGASLSGLPGVKAIGVNAGVGFRKNENSSVLAVSGGIKHTASGASIGGVYGYEDHDGGMKPTYWMVEAGWTGKINDMGSTSLGIGYGIWDDGGDGKSTRYHAAVVQRVTAAAADVYAGGSHDTGTNADGNDRDGVFILIAGARVKF